MARAIREGHDRPAQVPRRPLGHVARRALGSVALTTDTARAAVLTATCNNNAGDAAILQAAISASHPSDQVIIHGPCQLNTTITLLDNRRYSGDGRGATVITQAAGVNLPAMLASDSWMNDYTYTSSSITLEHLTLDGARSTNTQTVPLVLRTWDSLIQDIQIQNAPSDGILVTNLSQNKTALTNTSVNSTIRDFFITNSGAAGLRVVDTSVLGTDGSPAMTDWYVKDGWIEQSGVSAIHMGTAAGWQIHNVKIRGVGVHGIYAAACYATGIVGNFIGDFGDAGASGETYYGIYCKVQDGVTNVISRNRVNFLGTLPATGTYDYIAVEGYSGAPVVSVTGNAIRGQGTSRETALQYVLGGASSMAVTSTGNAVLNVGTARSSPSPAVTVTSGS